MAPTAAATILLRGIGSRHSRRKFRSSRSLVLPLVTCFLAFFPPGGNAPQFYQESRKPLPERPDPERRLLAEAGAWQCFRKTPQVQDAAVRPWLPGGARSRWPWAVLPGSAQRPGGRSRAKCIRAAGTGAACAPPLWIWGWPLGWQCSRWETEYGRWRYPPSRKGYGCPRREFLRAA